MNRANLRTVPSSSFPDCSAPQDVPSRSLSLQPIEIFSTCPASDGIPREDYARKLVDVARWSEEAGCHGILIYSDNSLLDPWLIAHLIIQNTSSLCPLVAVQPVYMHPYTVAKMIASLGHLYRRRLYLNMVAGGFKNDLIALNDPTPHDERYDRLKEYTIIIEELLKNPSGVTYRGRFYQVEHLKLTPLLPLNLFPGIFVSGSSEAGVESAKAIRATAIKYPKPPNQEGEILDSGIDYGIRVGIIARATEEEAWKVACTRFPPDRKGQITHQLAMKTSDSVWHRQLSEFGIQANNPYWLLPFQNYKTFCPYLVGSYERVAEELGRYIGLGYRTFILDIPPDKEELEHTQIGFRKAVIKAYGRTAA
ncbi:MAG: LLM class flavin-dependent oxidoreductase [Deltaproteobacteria bacterium]|nr:LLM class flavin-dependent oxidoreductase [Deltaproteobacteria bacterium]